MSQSDCQSKEIDGTKYSVYMLPPKTARKMLVRIFQVLGPCAGEAISKGDAEVSEAIGPLLSTLADRLNDEDLDWMMVELSKMTTAEVAPGKEPFIEKMFDSHFRGRIAHMMNWFLFALEAQFSDFFSGSEDGLAGLIARAMAKGEKASPSPSTLTGLSGDQSSPRDAA